MSAVHSTHKPVRNVTCPGHRAGQHVRPILFGLYPVEYSPSSTRHRQNRLRACAYPVRFRAYGKPAARCACAATGAAEIALLHVRNAGRMSREPGGICPALRFQRVSV
eukprot:IDg9651t1